MTAPKFWARYADSCITALGDSARSRGAKRRDHVDIVTTKLATPPEKYGLNHWSSRLLGKHLEVTVARAWHEYGTQS
ncbi:hypothetical protein [Brevibacterium zhoupengii]|uniref:hypothetical protein n=1 Tax=Brevibacterium zhoupengii TaxID=2898795 RepID=UPI001E4D9837|nr:hypothetical protein [Brevibacterium zhoupengii]